MNTAPSKIQMRLNSISKISQQGFTLIELLIVIVIIGILAGISIAVIDPVKQQNRARDAGIKATINKAALSTEGYVSAYGAAPSPVEFIAGLKNIKSHTCTSTTATSCTFEIEGNPLPVGGTAGCAANTWNGTGSTQCRYYYYRPSATSAQFTIYAKSFGLSTSIFKYDNTKGVIVSCDATSLGSCL